MLKMLGIRGNVLRWITNFMQNRMMRVIVNGNCSDWVYVLSEIPQGSVLGPLLFLIFVNDLPDWVKTNIRMFAGHTKTWTKMGNIISPPSVTNSSTKYGCCLPRTLMNFLKSATLLRLRNSSSLSLRSRWWICLIMCSLCGHVIHSTEPRSSTKELSESIRSSS